MKSNKLHVFLGVCSVAVILGMLRFAEASEVSGRVVSALDGDTIEVLHNHRAERIRLNGIDCPEKSQAYGKRAKQAGSALVFGKEVTLHTFGTDKYGRTLADVLLPDGTNVNHKFVKEGWCWWYRKYASGDTVLEGLEKEARECNKRLWVDPAPIPSWVYCKARRGQSLDMLNLVPLETETAGNTATRGPPQVGAVETAPASSSSPFPIIGNRYSHIYHRPDCPNDSQVA
jgi:micrococcal nuclease